MLLKKIKTWSKDQVKEEFGFDADVDFETYVEVDIERHDGSTVGILCGIVAGTGDLVKLRELTRN